MKTRSLRVTWRLVLGACCLLLGGWTAVEGTAEKAKPKPEDNAPGDARESFKKGIVIRFDGMITYANQQYLFRSLDAAKADGVDLVILEITSPGGYLEESLNIAKRLRDIDWAKVVAFVPDEAISGAAIMSLGCEEIVLAPHAQIGDAGAIYLNEGAMFEYAPEKFVSNLVGNVRELAESRDHNPAVAEAMVDREAVVYRCTHEDSDEVDYFTADELKSLDDVAAWTKHEPVHESREGKFLQLSGNRALELGFASGVADDRADLLGQYDLPKAPQVVQWTWVDTTVVVLNNWLISVLLIVGGLIALYIELSAPGISVGGLIAGLCFLLFFWARFLGGTAGWLEVILFVSGVAFIAAEIFVIPGFGVSGVAGILLLAVSMVLACQDFFIPVSRGDYSQLGAGMGVVLGSGVLFVVSAAVLSRFLPSIPFFNRIVLKPAAERDAELRNQGDGEGKKAPPAPEHDLPYAVGDWGTADSPLRPAGKARFGDEFVDVVTEGSFVEKGKQVRILSIRGNQVTVREVDS